MVATPLYSLNSRHWDDISTMPNLRIFRFMVCDRHHSESGGVLDVINWIRHSDGSTNIWQLGDSPCRMGSSWHKTSTLDGRPRTALHYFLCNMQVIFLYDKPSASVASSVFMLCKRRLYVRCTHQSAAKIRINSKSMNKIKPESIRIFLSHMLCTFLRKRV
jgi:hypothetical protein